jgi:Fur family transcriptional regulator, stress-responsive regulator
VRSPHELSTAFRAIGLKVTPQRQALFSLLHDNESHPSAEALHLAASAVMPGISLRTVYQTLNDLVSMGELQQLQLSPGSSRFDPNVSDHHHLVCDTCGEVRDVYIDGLDGVDVRGLDGFTVAAADVVFRGTCGDCETSIGSIGSFGSASASASTASTGFTSTTSTTETQRKQS